MKKEYTDVQAFLDDIHDQLSVKETILDMGLIERNDMKGDFTNCIFHDGDHTPSLQIKDKFWKCYACGARGDLVKFIQVYYNTDFMSAIRKLSDFLNINIKNATYKYDNKLNLLAQEWEQYLQNMREAPREVQELKRDFFPETIGYDKKINFVVLPITSKTGSILGFTKRRIDFLCEKDENDKFKLPKWKHSNLTDSMINLCHNVYNLENASGEIRKTKHAIITEGPKDVIAYRRINKPNCVCSCGTGNSTNIWDMILPVNHITLSYDGDEAGVKAFIASILHLTTIFNIKDIDCVELPDSEDPYSVGNLQDYYDNRILSVDYFIKHASVEEVKDLYDKTPDYNKTYIMKHICLNKSFSVSEAESWLDSASSQKQINNSLNMSEKEKLLAIVNCEDVDVELIPIEKAKKILKLKYGINC